MGQTSSLTNAPTDAANLLSDLYMNSDGSVNYVAVGLTVAVGLLIVRNWGQTTRSRSSTAAPYKRGKK